MPGTHNTSATHCVHGVGMKQDCSQCAAKPQVVNEDLYMAILDLVEVQGPFIRWEFYLDSSQLANDDGQTYMGHFYGVWSHDENGIPFHDESGDIAIQHQGLWRNDATGVISAS